MFIQRVLRNRVYSTGLIMMAIAALLAVSSMRPAKLHAASDWDARYWNNSTLSGNPVLQRFEANLDYDWGEGAPASEVNGNSFSARWERTLDFASGVYRFTITTDDGMRLWVDDVLIIDSWWDSQVHSLSADYFLGSGQHRLKVEYYQAGGKAVAKLHWSIVSNTPGAIYSWRGEYYNNVWLSGQPAMVRDDQKIDFDWGGGAPQWNIVNADQFSARWTRDVYLSGGRYRFVVTADDGVRLWVNGRLLIDEWHDASATFYSSEIDLYGGTVPIKMEYYENNGGAVAKLTWLRLTDTNISNWRGEYFNNRWLSGSPVVVRDDAEINFNWGYGAPAPGLPPDGYSARWTRDLYFSSGNYRFTTTSDDGVRLWVNGHLLIDSWQDQPATSYSNNIYLSGNVPVKMEYYESSHMATARLSWIRLEDYASPPPPPPSSGTVVVDDASSSFFKGGSTTAWRSSAGGHGGQVTWTWNNDKIRPRYNWARWYASLAPGRYEVFVYIPNQNNSTGNARYWVVHQGGYTLRTVDQSANGDRWVSLGTYQFQGNGRDYVALSDVTYESYLSRSIAFDAMKWEPR